ncbi:FAD-binding oxidoreductase [Micromonospora sp. NPDC048999]|uniref:FAD-binding oxidoreductase n=1 Tax=Micromonospora sp. NPDC048999 TaxID=3155391 RepID=UPI0033FE1FB7
MAADVELSAYLIGVDWDRLKAHLARSLTSTTSGEPEVPCLGWSEGQHRRAVDYLMGVLKSYQRPSAADFWEFVEDRYRGLLPEWTAPLLQDGLYQLVSKADDRPGRSALLAVLGRAYRRYGLRPDHTAVIDDALQTSVPWEEVERAAARVGDGPAWWPVEVLDHDLAADGVAVVTVRPWRRLRYLPGQAVPVCTPRRPGRWRWYCPANAPRPDGSIELHVRAVGDGIVSTSLVHEVRPGELLYLGPPTDTGLSLVDGDLLLVAGGTGLAPLRALVEQVAAAPTNRRVTLVVGARSIEALYDAVTLDKLRHDWLTIVPTFSHHQLDEPGEWGDGDALTVALDHRHAGQAVYVCGPPAMLAGSRLRLLAAGVPADRIHLPERIPWR